jgi:hypothetical protein
MQRWKRWVVAAFVGFLLYLCQIISNAVEAYKHGVHWEYQDLLAMLSGIGLFAIVAIAADAAVAWTRSSLLRRSYNHVFLLFLMSGGLAVVGRVVLPLYLAQLLWMAALVVLGMSFAHPKWRLDRLGATACLLASPGALLVFLNLFFLASSPPSLDAYFPRDAAVPSEARRTPVFFFVFDEWSFLRSTNNGEFLPKLKNMRDLASQSVCFTDAVSPAASTFYSLPRYIFQTDDLYKDNGANVGFERGGKFTPSTQTPSLLSLAREHGYKTYLTGFYHAYHTMMGNGVDYLRVHQQNRPPRRSFADTFWWRIERNGRFLNDPLSVALDLDNGIIGCHQWHEMNETFRHETLDFLSRSPPNTCAFFHTPWTHYPYTANPDGTFFGYSKELWNAANTAGYQRHLEYADSLMGEIIAELRSTGKYDDALLIFTSDHGWRTDPDQAFNRLPLFNRRIPLLIKLPGQKAGHVITTAFCPNHLSPLLDAVFAGEKNPQTLLAVLEKAASEQPPLDLEGDPKVLPPNED